MQVVSPLILGDDIRHCREDHVSNDNSSNDVDDDNSICNNSGNSNARKKIRLPKMTKPLLVSPASAGDDSGENQVQEESNPSPPRQWWFSRHSTSIPPASVTPNNADKEVISVKSQKDNEIESGMVLSEHLGRASDVVESLTHDVKNWSLTRLSTASTTTIQGSTMGNNSSRGFHLDKDRKMEKQKRCKDAQRQVRMARRRYLEEQKRLLSASNPSIY